jgi:DNA-directed RNA polymerase specialized sigma24 family protein
MIPLNEQAYQHLQNLIITNRLSYQEIAEKLGKDTKAVDNAVQRIKKKLESTLREGNEGNY